ncbi:LysR family transcriptional regulator [Roseibium denhamense]|uniref:Transcriptional regulator, LysR family n=1 Tax=Roseibium denhamense TaxID=76305 RepID=A0ABY1N5C1_9HYPH|nr:LysR substrate-binding domain-containing protein [Roseibium denhamense]MTI04631.1 LysR family transcriptional regulator [Roseibium denhamense]SMP00454.1 transcriptional regulator, LysR family [Roseibium denhamense]
MTIPRSRSRSALSLGQLRALEAVVRTGSFSAAAKDVGVSQPSISNHIQGLEGRYKTKLLVKSGYSVTPAPALKALLPKIRAALALTRDIESELARQTTLTAGDLRIGYSTYQLAIPRISHFMSRYPDIVIEARALATQDILDLFENGDIDIGFVTGKEIPAGLDGELLMQSRIVLAAPSDHPLATRDQVTWTDVAKLPLLQRESTSGTRRLFEGAATVAGIKPKTILALGSWGSIATLIRSGLGLGIAMEAELSERDGCIPIPISDPALIARHYVVWQKEMAKVATVEAFRASLLEPLGVPANDVPAPT